MKEEWVSYWVWYHSLHGKQKKKCSIISKDNCIKHRVWDPAKQNKTSAQSILKTRKEHHMICNLHPVFSVPPETQLRIFPPLWDQQHSAVRIRWYLILGRVLLTRPNSSAWTLVLSGCPRVLWCSLCWRAVSRPHGTGIRSRHGSQQAEVFQ